jgi:hypothetical protein
VQGPQQKLPIMEPLLAQNAEADAGSKKRQEALKI